MKTMMSITASLMLAVGLTGAALAQDYTEPPAFGRIDLNAGFSPDPYARNLTAGGSIRAQNRNSSCRGYIANAPDFSVYYTAGSLPLIFSVDSDSDTTLVINGPDTRWHCDDDGAREGFNPMVRFNDPQSGRYDVWVGTYSEGSGVPATLFISELDEYTRQSAGFPSLDPSDYVDIGAAARYADIALNGGFLPDPYQLRLTAGGPISADDAIDNANGSCRGYITAEPSVELDYNGSSDLYIYTDGDADTTLVINGPDGSWHCNDDAVGTDAGLSFTARTRGIYDIYVGTYSRGERPTTLRISEIQMGHRPSGK